MKEFINRYTSRKLILTVAGAVALYSAGAYDQVVILLIGYIGVQGGSEIVSKYKSKTLTASDIEAVTDNYEVDTSKIVSGKPKPTPLFNEEEKE
jgi:hypothetical protein